MTFTESELGETQPCIFLSTNADEQFPNWFEEGLSKLTALVATSSCISSSQLKQLDGMMSYLGWDYTDKFEAVANGRVHIVITDSCETTG